MVALNALLSLIFVLVYASAAPLVSQREELIFADIHSPAGGGAAPGLNTRRQFNPRDSHLGGLRPVGRGPATEKGPHRARRRRSPQGLPGPLAPPNPATSQTDAIGTTTPFPQAIPAPAADPVPAPDAASAPAPDPASVPAPSLDPEPDTTSAPDGTSATPTDPAAPVSTTIDSPQWPSNSLCGKSITATAGANSVNVTVADRCEGCQFNDLDFSPAAFGGLANMTAGRIDITWAFNDP
ncbi:hypothetical protein EWM64_g4399 [Hericium alpestre]|uniref:RlpA-like protein double-psi beta-barrel domain-containing protein n=1 Tax=Hericium alpestre TaxID=135208 RepID=A0A4Y9ZZI9_9AGAM|nr:hypothetical protein EWM64_g4399 [Hericium alpestre]